LKEEIENQESKKIADEKQVKIVMDMLKRRFGIQETAFLEKWMSEAIKKLKEEIENQKCKKVVDEKQKQIVMNVLKRGRISIQEIALLTK
jgi:hypothetical protein